MSDSFADLWNSSTPSNPPPKPATLGSQRAQSSVPSQGNASRPRHDAFALLAATTSQSNSRSVTPSMPLNSSGRLSAKPSSPSTGNGDAFGSLLGTSFSASSKNNSSLSLADRQAQSRQEQRGQVNAVHTNNQVWDGLDMLGTSSTQTASSSGHHAQPVDDWDLDFGGPSKPSPAPSQPQARHNQQPSDLFDFLSDSAPPRRSQPPPSQPKLPILQDTLGLTDINDSLHGSDEITGDPGDFDFGDRIGRGRIEDSYGSDGEGDEKLSILESSRPTGMYSGKTTRATETSPIPRSSSSSSPPPHIVGQIVAMGFAPQQARLALAATDSGLDVQQALEMLLENGADPVSIVPPARESSMRDGYQNDSDVNGMRRGSRQTSNDTRTSSVSQRSNTQASSTTEASADLQVKADKLIAQASEIGFSMFNRANKLWAEGKARAQKVYEEQIASSSMSSESVTAAGRRGSPAAVNKPRWMTDDVGLKDENQRTKVVPGAGSFRDEHEGDGDAAAPSPLRPAQAPPPPTRLKDTLDLFVDEPIVYASPARRRGAGKPSTLFADSSEALSPPPRVPSPPPQLIQRATITASPSAIAASNSHKSKGTEMFKLGRYAEAEQSYSSALSALPEAHLLRIPLLNNRAVSRLKTGDHTGAAEDCSTVIMMIGDTYDPTKEMKISKIEEGRDVDLGDALVKAFKRRAEAFEGREKWDIAMKDWEAIVRCDWAARSRRDALSGLARCKTGLKVESEPVVSKPVSRPPPPIPSQQQSSAQTYEAVQKLREANKASEEEDQQKHELKDTVDARLLSWKGGKEANLRALIASLENVLWPELGWQKVGMHELITPSQVKIRYTKAIAKLHPDKLTASNTTLEHRMIANGVFASLNEAWVAFKP